jgi:hypothetical protein
MFNKLQRHAAQRTSTLRSAMRVPCLAQLRALLTVFSVEALFSRRGTADPKKESALSGRSPINFLGEAECLRYGR